MKASREDVIEFLMGMPGVGSINLPDINTKEIAEAIIAQHEQLFNDLVATNALDHYIADRLYFAEKIRLKREHDNKQG